MYQALLISSFSQQSNKVVTFLLPLSWMKLELRLDMLSSFVPREVSSREPGGLQSQSPLQLLYC